MYTIAQGFSAPSYAGYTLDFDEPGGPTGLVSPTDWQESHGLTINSGVLVPEVQMSDHLDGYYFHGNFGVNIYFDRDVTELSFQNWTSAPVGFRVRLFDDGELVAVLFNEDVLADGDWIDITTAGGAVFDEVEVWGVPGSNDLDNLSWNTVPCPDDIIVDGLVGFADLTVILGNWGACANCNDCPGDLDGDCNVGFTDLTQLLGSWGPCP